MPVAQLSADLFADPDAVSAGLPAAAVGVLVVVAAALAWLAVRLRGQLRLARQRAAEAEATLRFLAAKPVGAVPIVQPPVPVEPRPAVLGTGSDEERLRFLADLEALLVKLPAMRDTAALEKLRRENADLGRRLERENRPLGELRAECLRLAQALAASAGQAAELERLALFSSLEQLLVQGPTLCHAAERSACGRSAPGPRDFASMLRLLFAAFERLGFGRIGTVGGCEGFDPRVHELGGGWHRPAKPGEPVEVVFVGYRRGEDVLRRAQVSLLSD